MAQISAWGAEANVLPVAAQAAAGAAAALLPLVQASLEIGRSRGLDVRLVPVIHLQFDLWLAISFP